MEEEMVGDFSTDLIRLRMFVDVDYMIEFNKSVRCNQRFFDDNYDDSYNNGLSRIGYHRIFGDGKGDVSGFFSGRVTTVNYVTGEGWDD